MSIPDILQYLTILKTPPVIRFAQLLSILTSTVIAAAGLIQLVSPLKYLQINFDLNEKFQIQF